MNWVRKHINVIRYRNDFDITIMRSYLWLQKTLCQNEFWGIQSGYIGFPD